MSTTTAATTPTAPARIPSARISAAQLEALAARVATEGERERMEIDQPFTGAPLGTVPRCTPDDVRAALARARAAQAEWARTSFAERAAGAAALPRPGAGAPGRDPRPDPDRVRQGAPPRVRGGARRRDRRPLLRQHRRAPPEAAPPPRRAAAADGGLRAPPPGRGGGHHRALELPVHALDQRRHAGAGGRQRGRHQARLQHAVHGPVGVRPARGGGPAGRASCRWSPARAPSWGRT